MRYGLLLVLLALLGTVQGQEEGPRSRPAGPSIEGMAKGDVFTIKRLKESFRVQGERSQRVRRSISTLRLVVLAELENGGRRLRWTLLDNGTEQEGSIPLKAIIRKLDELSAGVSFEFEIDAQGNPTGLCDKQAVIASYEELAKKLQAWGEASATDKATLDAVLNGIKAYTHPDTVELLSLRDAITLFFRPDPIPARGESVAREGQIPNPLGGPPLPSSISVHWRLDKDRGDWLVHTQALDVDKATVIMREAMETKALEQGQPLPADFKLPRYQLTEEANLLLGSGRLPDQIYFQSKRLTDGAGQIEQQHYLCQRGSPKATAPEKQ
ncbi:MAG: hypothetical protein H6807_00355 [Planctomycetes bacterium]|nr:hypothetical protein [Planctomycetota bacterium]